jgi:uncharacterized protein (TIGR00730 family)
MNYTIDSQIEFLDGPNNRGKELWFSLRVWYQLIQGFRKLHFKGPCITIFGSARISKDHPYYATSELFGKEVSKMGFTVLTGGGPGLMEAANKGAYEAGGKSIGVNILLPKEQQLNLYLHDFINIKYFFVRKTLLVKYSYAFIIMPGGYGTMDEFFEIITLIQTGMVFNFPVILFGREFHAHLLNHIDYMQKEGMITNADVASLLVTDDIEEAMNHIKSFLKKNYAIKHIQRAWWILGESR